MNVTLPTPVFRSMVTFSTPLTRSTERLTFVTQNGHDMPLIWMIASADRMRWTVSVCVGLPVVEQPGSRRTTAVAKINSFEYPVMVQVRPIAQRQFSY